MTAVRPVVAAGHRAGEACEDGAGEVVALGRAPADDATNPALEEWPVGQLAGRSARRSGRRRALSAAAELVDRGRAAPARPGAGPRRRRPAARAVGARRRPAAARAGPARQPDRRRPAALAPVGVGAGHPAPRPRPSWPAGCAGRCPRRPRRRPGGAPRSTPGWRSGSARRSWSTSTSCPARATSSPPPTARWPTCRRRSSPASGPTGSRPRSRCRSRRRSARSRCAAGSTPSTPTATAATRSSTGRPGRRRPGAELAAAGVQLAAYRLGWSRLTGVPVERVSAGFHHVAAKETLRPVDLLDEAGLLAWSPAGDSSVRGVVRRVVPRGERRAHPGSRRVGLSNMATVDRKSGSSTGH